MRKIPATMATQHPDNACAPYWLDSPEVTTHDEVEECYRMFSELGCNEYMWDWEGKFVDEAVVDRLFHDYYKYFQKNQLGRDKFLTFRIPNIWKERGTRLARSFMAIITAAYTAKDHKVNTPPLFEVILPMTSSADQLITVLKKFKKAVASQEGLFEEEIFKEGRLEMIPLIEGSVTLLESRLILKSYVQQYKKLYGKKPKYLRPFIARSDPALDAGFISGVLSARGALSEYYKFQRESKIKVFPIIGLGSLHFRGGLTPLSIDRFVELYAGVRTATLQSSFRYDYSKAQVKKALLALEQKLPKAKAPNFSPAEIKEIHQLIRIFSRAYRPVVQGLAGTVNDLAQYVPSHRERIPHTGHFGYSRKVGRSNVQLPRAISFVATFASLGIPPSLIGTGRGLRAVIRAGKEQALLKYFPGLHHDLVEIGHFLNWENLKFLCRQDTTWAKVREDVLMIEDYLGKRLGPTKADHYIHRNLSSNIYHYWRQRKKNELVDAILQAAVVRKSLG